MGGYRGRRGHPGYPGPAAQACGCGRGEPWSSISGMSPAQALEFSAGEMRRRRAAFGRELDRSGASYGLVYGANRSGSAVSWLTGWPVTREALLVVAPEAVDNVLPFSFFNHRPQAPRLSAT